MKTPKKTKKSTQKPLTAAQKRAIERGAVMFSKNAVDVMRRLAKS